MYRIDVLVTEGLAFTSSKPGISIKNVHFKCVHLLNPLFLILKYDSKEIKLPVVEENWGSESWGDSFT